jgi:hypothetical protein
MAGARVPATPFLRRPRVGRRLFRHRATLTLAGPTTIRSPKLDRAWRVIHAVMAGRARCHSASAAACRSSDRDPAAAGALTKYEPQARPRAPQLAPQE